MKDPLSSMKTAQKAFSSIVIDYCMEGQSGPLADPYT
jgi:hypothetical protein